MKKTQFLLAGLIFIFAIPMGYAVDYPFGDDMEGAINWTAESPWALTDAEAHSPTHCWADSPGDYYDNNADVSLTLSSPVDLSGVDVENPQLKFWHKYEFESDYDFGYLEISTDGGTAWTTLVMYTGTSGGGIQPAWVMEQISLAAYQVGNVLFRFRLVSDKTIVNNGWFIDDVAIAELPHPVDLAAPYDATDTSLTLEWTRNLDSDFAAYEIYRSTEPVVNLTSTLVSTISDQGTTTYTDTSLPPGTTFYYRVYVISNYEMNAASKLESGTTLRGPYFFWDFENGTGDWTMSGAWAVAGEDSRSPTQALSDSPGGTYEDSVDAAASTVLNLFAASRPHLSFWHKYSFETNHDFGGVEVSVDGSNWTRLFFVTGTTVDEWVQEELDLSAYGGQEIYLRFRITSDNNGITSDGWHIDDVEITENTATTPLPFFDDFEQGDQANWLLSTWRQSAVVGHSGLWSVTDSPLGNMGENVYTSLTLRGTVDLSAVSNPRLGFWYQFNAYNDDFLCVYVSTNGGRDWQRVWEFGNYSSQPNWTYVQLDLSSYRSPRTAIRFSVEDRRWGNGNGANIDDVVIAATPENVVLNEPEDVTERSITVSWSQSQAGDFRRYTLYRSQSPGITGARSEDTLQTTVYNIAETSFIDSVDFSGSTWYYRVFVEDTRGLINSGSNEVSATTLSGIEPGGFPYADDMEDGDKWGNDLPWSLTDEDSFSGSYSFTDSPGTNYENNLDRSLKTIVDLGPAIRPYLSFRHKYIFESNHDFGWVEVSVDGSNWTRLFFVTDSSLGEWVEEELDLSAYAGQEIYLRFRITSDDNGITRDGWYIDDVAVLENTATTPLPFFDDFEQGAKANWLLSNWRRQSATEGHSGLWSVTDSPLGNMGENVYTSLTLRGTVDLSAVSNPRMGFWYQFNAENDDFLCVYVSTNGGREWQKIWEFGNYSNQPNWTYVQLDLSPYRSTRTAIRFSAEDRRYGDGNGADIDDVLIEAAPENVVLNEPENVTEHSITISWSQSQAGDFHRYTLYKSQSPGITGARSEDMLLTTVDTIAETSFVDSVDFSGSTWYYRVFVEDTRGLISSGSNEVSATTPSGIEPGGFPYADDMEDGDKWGNDLPWSLTDEDSFSGSYSFTDSPGTNYENNLDRSLKTTVDLGPAIRPYLFFRHKYSFETYHDFGWVEVSVDGSNWTRLFFVTDSSLGEWVEEELDLSAYAGQEIYLRFRITSDDNGITSDGWYIDDVAVLENTATTPLPFFDDFEQGAKANWLLSNWRRQSATDSHSGLWSVTDSPLGNMGENVYTSLTLRGTVDLTAAPAPWLGFWYQFNAYNDDFLCVYVSTNGGRDWQKIWEFGNYSSQPNWTYIQLDLSSYRSPRTAIRFSVEDRRYGDGNGANIDDVSISATDGAIHELAITPESTSTMAGSTFEFTVTGYDGAGSPIEMDPTTVDWMVKGDIGSIDDEGHFTALNGGIGSITVTYGQTKTITGIIEVTEAAGGTTQIEQGTVLGSDAVTAPEDNALYFIAYIAARPAEILTQASGGCGYASGTWQVNIGNFPTSWIPGEYLRIDFVDTQKGESGSLEYTLAYGGQTNDITLLPVSYDLITTDTTNVNVLSLIKDSGVANAEELVQLIPNASEIAYWDAIHQRYIGHSIGSPLMNFPVLAGHPYFVTVTAASTFTPTGNVPDPWPEFNLLVTGTTNVNMVTLPLNMSRVTRAEEMGHMILDCTEVARWDTENQAYEAHTYGAPLFDFGVSPALPYFVTVVKESQWPLAALALAGRDSRAGGITQNEGGQVYSSNMSAPADGVIVFTAYIQGRESEILSESSAGCGYGSGYWQVNIGNFATAWDAGDLLRVEISNTANGERATLEIVLEYGGQVHDVVLLPDDLCECDLNGDGKVDGFDLALLIADFGRTDCGGLCQGDFSGDGDVDGSDIERLIAEFGRADCR